MAELVGLVYIIRTIIVEKGIVFKLPIGTVAN
jgi:hypothetical protein